MFVGLGVAKQVSSGMVVEEEDYGGYIDEDIRQHVHVHLNMPFPLIRIVRNYLDLIYG